MKRREYSIRTKSNIEYCNPENSLSNWSPGFQLNLNESMLRHMHKKVQTVNDKRGDLKG